MERAVTRRSPPRQEEASWPNSLLRYGGWRIGAPAERQMNDRDRKFIVPWQIAASRGAHDQHICKGSEDFFPQDRIRRFRCTCRRVCRSIELTCVIFGGPAPCGCQQMASAR